MSLIKRGKLVINTAGFVKNSLTQQTVVAVWRCAFDAQVKLPATGTKTSHSAMGGLQAYRHSAQGHNLCVYVCDSENERERKRITDYCQYCAGLPHPECCNVIVVNEKKICFYSSQLHI